MRSVLITGASTGIGCASALRLDAAGWRVFAGVRSEGEAEALRTAGSGRLVPLMLDVTDAGQISAAAEQVGEAVGKSGLDGLVNNAGISVAFPLEAFPIEDFRRLVEVNLVGQVAVTQALLPQIREAAGRVVFISSIGGRLTPPLLGAYSATKSGLEVIAGSFRQELRRWRISVSVVEPGAIATPIWDLGEEAIERLLAQTPAETGRLYGKAIAAFREVSKRMRAHAIAPEKIAGSIEHALTARRPRSRYLVGGYARRQALARSLFPDRALDFFVARAMGL